MNAGLFENGLSLGWRTELIFARFDGQVVDRGDHLLVLTPTNPGYWWGNFLLFRHAPGAGDFERWTALFDKENPLNPINRRISIVVMNKKTEESITKEGATLAVASQGQVKQEMADVHAK